jgi:4'-phosphopantetheinyl transferase EntD
MIEQLLPSYVASVATLADDPSASLFPEEAALVVRAVESRISEFTTTRTCARNALGKLGLPRSPILCGAHREPLWPPGIVGSMTHCYGYRAAAVAKQTDLLALGIDAEPHGQLPPEVLERVVTCEEEAWLAKAPIGTYWDRLLFSAKESVYKALFPLWGEWLDWTDAIVTPYPEDGTFSVRLLVPPPNVRDRDLTTFQGRFLTWNGLVITAVAIQQAEKPLGGRSAPQIFD